MHKLKPLFGIGTSLLFVFGGFYLWLEKSKQDSVSNPNLIKLFGIGCVILFGLLSLIGIVKFFKNNTK